VSIDKGVLFVVATPIGNRDDFSPRAVTVLKQVDLIAVEDTRHSTPLFRHFGIDTPLLALHEHNERKVMERVIRRLEAGASVALVSDAGTPLISDPGFPLVRECIRLGLTVTPVPGPSALICALSVAGLPTDRFVFEGFPSRTGSARKRQFEQLAEESRTLAFYESSHRIVACLTDMAEVFGPDRPAVIARELTKLHETLISSTLGQLVERLQQEPVQQKGEFVVLVAGVDRNEDAGVSPEAAKLLTLLMEELPLKQAAALAARYSGEKKNRLYQMALEMQSER
jgi:16S rRNA (cytidine1402-2'-O)-methyltransferase